MWVRSVLRSEKGQNEPKGTAGQKRALQRLEQSSVGAAECWAGSAQNSAGSAESWGGSAESSASSELASMRAPTDSEAVRFGVGKRAAQRRKSANDTPGRLRTVGPRKAAPDTLGAKKMALGMTTFSAEPVGRWRGFVPPRQGEMKAAEQGGGLSSAAPEVGRKAPGGGSCWAVRHCARSKLEGRAPRQISMVMQMKDGSKEVERIVSEIRVTRWHRSDHRNCLH